MQTKFIDNLRDKTKKAQEKNKKEDELLSLQNKKAVKMHEEIRKFSKTNPEKAAGILVKKIIISMKEMAEESKNQYNWYPENYRDLQNKVVAKLKKMGFKVKVDCSHGHGGYSNGRWTSNGIGCKGTTYASCAPVVIISW